MGAPTLIAEPLLAPCPGRTFCSVLVFVTGTNEPSPIWRGSVVVVEVGRTAEFSSLVAELLTVRPRESTMIVELYRGSVGSVMTRLFVSSAVKPTKTGFLEFVGCL